MEYLDFELPIKELKEQLEKCYEIGIDSDVDVIATCKKIEKKLEKTKKEIGWYTNFKILLFKMYSLMILENLKVVHFISPLITIFQFFL